MTTPPVSPERHPPAMSFYDRCHLEPAPWRALEPGSLAPAKERREAQRVKWAHKKPAFWRRWSADCVVREVEQGVAEFKRAYSACNARSMLYAAEILKAPVHSLRVALRAEDDAASLPPRLSQFRGLGC